MGLDAVELVMAVEQRFGITLDDESALSCTTPGDLVNCVFSKLETEGATGRLSAHAFYALRRELVRTFGFERRRIAPDTPLENLWSPNQRRWAWHRLGVALQSKTWIQLEHPAWLQAVMIGLSILTLFLVLVSRSFITPWLSAPLGLAIIVGLFQATKPLARELPKRIRTVGQLSEFLVGAAPRLFEPNGRRWTRPEVAKVIREIVIEELGIKPNEYREDASFVKDYGV